MSTQELIESALDGRAGTVAWSGFLRNRLQEFLQMQQGNAAQLRTLNAIFGELRDILHPKTEGKTQSKGTKKYLLHAWEIVASRLKRQQGMLDPAIVLG